MKINYRVCWPGEPGGHVCFLAEQALKAKRSDVQLNMAAARSRQTALAKGLTGTIKGLSSNVGDAAKALIPKQKTRETV